jgi:hypothetical protein
MVQKGECFFEHAHNLHTDIMNADCNTANMTQHISTGEALQLVTPFSGEKREVSAFTANANTTVNVTDLR